MKIRLFGLLGLAMVVCLASFVEAQDEQGRRGRRGGPRGGFGGFGGPGGFQQGPALQLMGLLQMSEVRAEVGIDDTIWNAIPDEAKRVDFRAMFQASEEERERMLAETNEKAQETLDEVLAPDKQKRLMGLLAQRVGYQAATNDLVAKEIGLNEEGLTKVKEVAEQANDDMREQMREAFGGRGRGRGRGGFDPEAVQEMQAQMEEWRNKANETIAAALTEEQKQNFENLKGAKFEFPEQAGFGRRGFRGRGGPGRGGPGRGGADGRPGGGDRPSGSDN